MESMMNELIMVISAAAASEGLELVQRWLPWLRAKSGRLKQLLAFGLAAGVAWLSATLGLELGADPMAWDVSVYEALVAGGLSIAYHHVKRGGK